MEIEKYQVLLENANNAKYKESTAKGYNSCLHNVCNDIKTLFDFNKLKHSDIVKLIVIWQNVLSNSTINNRLTELRKLCDIAHRDGLWPHNPCDGIKSLPRDQIIEMKPFTKEELQKMANTSTLQYSAKHLVFFTVHTGLRMEEVLALDWSDVDWENRTLSIKRARALNYCYSPKTKQSKRVIPLTEDALEILKEQFAVTGGGPKHTIKMKDKSANSVKNITIMPIFIDDSTGNMFKNSKDFSQRFFTKFLQTAEVAHRGPSQLRHTFASHALSGGVPIAYISKIMGHADTKTTETHYAQYLPCNRIEDMVRLSAALSFEEMPSATLKPPLRNKISTRFHVIKTYFSQIFGPASNRKCTVPVTQENGQSG